MSSYQLHIAHAKEYPVHCAFSYRNDLFAILWASGLVEVWKLRTRLGPGKGKVMDPIQVWEASITESGQAEFRQITFVDGKSGGEHCIAALASYRADGGCDAVILRSCVPESGEPQGKNIRTVDLPERNGRLVCSEDGLYWQSPTGSLFKGSCRLMFQKEWC